MGPVTDLHLCQIQSAMNLLPKIQRTGRSALLVGSWVLQSWSSTTTSFAHIFVVALQVLHPDLLNENMVRAEYAVRGELYHKGEELRKQGREVIFTNGIAPLLQTWWPSVDEHCQCTALNTFYGGTKQMVLCWQWETRMFLARSPSPSIARLVCAAASIHIYRQPSLAQITVKRTICDISLMPQVLSLLAAPALLEHPKVAEIYPSDAIARAKQVLTYFPGGLGAYSDSRGSAGVRKEIADFISQRDGYPSDPNVRPHCQCPKSSGLKIYNISDNWTLPVTTERDACSLPFCCEHTRYVLWQHP